MNKANLTQSYQVYPKAQFLDQFYLIFFSTTFYFLFEKPQFFADDNTLASLPLHSKNYFQFWNPDKFQVILLDKRGFDNTNIVVKVGKKLNRLHQLSFSEFI